MNDIATEIAAESRRIEEDSEYSAKSHFCASARWLKIHLWVGLPTAILAGVAGVTALSNYITLSACISIAVAAATAVMTFLNPTERAATHLDAGNKYNSLRNRTRIFRNVDLRIETPERELADQLKGLADQRDELNLASPAIPRWAFKAARRSIRAGEADYVVDSEVRRQAP